MSRKSRQNHSRKAIAKAAPPQATPSSAQGLRFEFSTLAGLSLLLVIATLTLYMPIADHPFIDYDDGTYITENPYIHSGLNFETLKWATTAIYLANWHPLTWMVHAVDFQLYGLNAGGHHVTSMIIHAANACLLFLILAIVTHAVGLSFLVAALFALHPLNVESVAWASELKNVLCTFFFLLSLGAYAWYARKPGILRLMLVLLLFAFGLASKPMVITLPFVLLLLDFWPLCRVQGLTEPSPIFVVPQHSVKSLVLEKLPLFVLSAASAWITVRAQTAWKATELIHVPLGARLTNALVSYATYVVKTFFPIGLALYIPFPIQGTPLWQLLVSLIFLLVLSAFVLRYGLRHRYLLIGWLFFLGTLIPVLGILQVGGQARADRYTYIPVMGLLLSIVWGVSEIADAKRVSVTLRMVSPLLILVVFYALSVRQISYWGSNYELWTHTISVTGNNAMAERTLSMELIRSGRTSEVYQHLRRAVDLDPNDFASRVNLGNAYSSQDRQQEALHEFVTVMDKSTDPRLQLAASINAGSSYRKLGDLNNAENAYRLALRISPNNPSAREGLNAIERVRASPSTASTN